MSTVKLTPREQEFVLVLGRLSRTLGYAPSLKDVADHMELSEARVRYLAKAAETAGVVTHDARVARSWRLTGKK
jgi:hypothetical protein